jgi:hypothetical protein
MTNMKKIVYTVLAACILAGNNSCEDKDYELIASATDDHTSESGGDYYSGEGIDVSMYEKARIFPGLVDTLTEERLDNVALTLDLTRRYVSGASVNLISVPSPIFSTGLYAGAGEKVTVELDEDIKGLSIQIGIHERDLSALSITGRDPKIVTVMPLFKGKNEIRNSYGGYIWIRRSGADGSDRNAFPLKISGVYAAPDYVPGETQTDDWMEKIEATTVPWIELRGKHYAFSVPTPYIKKKVNASGREFAERLAQSLQLWDEWMRCIYEFYGLDDTDAGFPMPDYPARAIMDVHLNNERYSYYNGNITELLKTEELIDLVTVPEAIRAGEQNTVHIMGWLQLYICKPTNTFGSMTLPVGFSTVYPLLPNFRFLHKNRWWDGSNRVVQQYRIGGTQVMQKGSSYEMKAENFEKLIAFASADSCKLYDPNASVAGDFVYTAFAFFADIMSYRQGDAGKNGWKFFGWFNRYLAQNKIGNRNLTDALLTALTAYFERDFTPLFDRWGLTISDDVRIVAVAKPPIEKCIWQFDPLTDAATPDFDGKVFYTQSGKTPLRHLRGAWNAVAYSASGASLQPYNQRADYSPFNLFDGDRNTLWESYYDTYKDYTADGITYYAYHTDSLYYKARTPDFPYTIVIQPGYTGLDKADGFYLANGNADETSIYNSDSANYDAFSFHPQRMIVEVTASPLEYNDIDSLFENLDAVAWTRVYDSDSDVPGSATQQFWPDRHNLFYIDFDNAPINIRGIRLTFDRDSHTAKDRPVDFPVSEKPRRPEFANPYLNRIQKFGEFGTYYYTN